jgi:hypothetical protein
VYYSKKKRSDTRTNSFHVYLFKCWWIFCRIISSTVVDTFKDMKKILSNHYLNILRIFFQTREGRLWWEVSRLNFNRISFDLIWTYFSCFLLLMKSLKEVTTTARYRSDFTKIYYICLEKKMWNANWKPCFLIRRSDDGKSCHGQRWLTLEYHYMSSSVSLVIKEKDPKVLGVRCNKETKYNDLYIWKGKHNSFVIKLWHPSFTVLFLFHFPTIVV